MNFLPPKSLSVFIVISFGLIPGSRIVEAKTVMFIHFAKLTLRSVEPIVTTVSRESHCYCSIAKLWPSFCDPMDCSMPNFPVLHPLPEFAQTRVC